MRFSAMHNAKGQFKCRGLSEMSYILPRPPQHFPLELVFDHDLLNLCYFLLENKSIRRYAISSHGMLFCLFLKYLTCAKNK